MKLHGCGEEPLEVLAGHQRTSSTGIDILVDEVASDVGVEVERGGTALGDFLSDELGVAIARDLSVEGLTRNDVECGGDFSDGEIAKNAIKYFMLPLRAWRPMMKGTANIQLFFEKSAPYGR